MTASSPLAYFARATATWFGCGLFPFGPGTVGSLAALLIAYELHTTLQWLPWQLGALGVALIPLGIWASNVEIRFRGVNDPSQVVVDEVAGQWITLAGASVFNWKSWLAALLLFRLFDIWKPFPVRQLEALPGGTGIMADDVMAGIYGAFILFLAGILNLY